jgi:hypothetical protein
LLKRRSAPGLSLSKYERRSLSDKELSAAEYWKVREGEGGERAYWRAALGPAPRPRAFCIGFGARAYAEEKAGRTLTRFDAPEGLSWQQERGLLCGQGCRETAGKYALLSCLAKLAIGQVLRSARWSPMLLLSRWQLPHPWLLLGMIRKAKEIFWLLLSSHLAAIYEHSSGAHRGPLAARETGLAKLFLQQQRGRSTRAALRFASLPVGSTGARNH